MKNTATLDAKVFAVFSSCLLFAHTRDRSVSAKHELNNNDQDRRTSAFRRR